MKRDLNNAFRRFWLTGSILALLALAVGRVELFGIHANANPNSCAGTGILCRVIGIPSQAYERGRNCRGTLSVLQSLCRTQNDAVRYNALPHEPPQSDQ